LQGSEAIEDLNIRLSRPRPQFLRFLEHVSFSLDLEQDFAESAQEFWPQIEELKHQSGMALTLRRLSMGLAVKAFL